MNDMGDFDAPIQRPAWQGAEAANERQAKTWGELVDKYLDQHGMLSIITACMWVCEDVRVRPENHTRVYNMVERFVRENPKYDVPENIVSKQFDPYQHTGYIKPSTATINDYTCKGCGNTKCSKQEKSCWKCGRTIGT